MKYESVKVYQSALTLRNASVNELMMEVKIHLVLIWLFGNN